MFNLIINKFSTFQQVIVQNLKKIVFPTKITTLECIDTDTAVRYVMPANFALRYDIDFPIFIARTEIFRLEKTVLGSIR